MKNLAFFSLGASPIPSPIDPHDAEYFIRDINKKEPLDDGLKYRAKPFKRVHYRKDC